VRLPSGEVRKVHLDCRATIGQIGKHRAQQRSGGQSRTDALAGWRPHNRGVTMNPVDHPMGGGEGRFVRWSPPLLALGPARQGAQDARKQE